MKRPRTPEEWQFAVDAAAAGRVIADLQMYGLLKGPEFNAARCDEILEQGARRGVTPSRPAEDLAFDLITSINAEAEEAKNAKKR